MGRFSISVFVVVLAMLVADASSVVGQVTPTIGPGSRVRLTASSLGLSEAVGTVQEATDEAFVVQFEYPRRLASVDRSEIGRMDVSIGQQRKVGKSFGIGALVGAASGIVIGLASGDDQDCFLLCYTAEEKAAIFGLGLGLTGGAVGLIIGLVRHQDVWFPMLPEDVDPTVLPIVRDAGAGLHVGLALRF